MSEESQYDTEALSEIVTLFNEAESAIKYIEDFGENLIVPAVNQLRYTGNHLVRYLSSPTNREELRDASKHVKRATYDAYEAAILYHLLEYNKFKNDYRRVIVSQVIQDYNTIQESVESARSFVRANQESNTRGENYKNGKKHLEVIINNTNRLNAGRDELNKLIRKERRNFLVAILAALTLTVTIVQLFICK